MTPDPSYCSAGAREQCEDNKWDGKKYIYIDRGIIFIFP